MMKILKAVLQIALFVLPWRMRRILLMRGFGYSIHSEAYIGLSVILADQLIMESKTSIGHLTICNGIDQVVLNEYGSIGTLNYITGYPSGLHKHFSHVQDRKCSLIIGRHSAITSRHFIDCTASIHIGNYSTVAGIATQMFTHSIDLRANRQHASAIRIGDYCFIGTRCVILPGTDLPNYSVLAAGSVVQGKMEETYSLYGGVPAKLIKKYRVDEMMYFHRATGRVD